MYETTTFEKKNSLLTFLHAVTDTIQALLLIVSQKRKQKELQSFSILQRYSNSWLTLCVCVCVCLYS